MEKMREEFEAWCKSTGFTLKPNAFNNGDYAMGYGWEEWNAWQASRAALCVKLPDSVDFCGDLFIPDGGVTNALDDAGVRYE